MSYSSSGQSSLLRPLGLTSASSLPESARSTTTGAAIPEFAGLTPEDIDILDEVIERAGPNAATFLTVFKAYNDVLQERGLDPHEVVYYARLLKLGTLRGRSWKEKWHMVKLQHGYGGRYGEQTRNPAVPAVLAARLTTRFSTPCRDDDNFTLYSHNETTNLNQPEIDRADETPQYHLTPPRFRSLDSPLGLINSSKLTSDLEFSLPMRHPNPFTYVPSSLARKKVHAWDGDSSEMFESGLPTTPPSYRAAVRAPVLRKQYIPNSKDPPSSASTVGSFARHHLSLKRDRRADVVSEDDPWNKVKIFQDEKDADLFREDRLIERCWRVWKQSYQWTRTTEKQIARARAKILLGASLQRWRTRVAIRIELSRKATKLASKHLLKRAFRAWHIRLQEKRQTDWRNSMRSKMHIVRVKREAKLRRDAWVKWRQSHHSQLSERYYTRQLVLRMYQCWKKRSCEIEHLEAVAGEVYRCAEERVRERSWDFWKKASVLKCAERITLGRVGARVISDVLDIWMRRMRDNRIADAFRNTSVRSHALRSWKAAHDGIGVLEHRAVKHQVRQDDLLTRAIWRVWKARERARLLERVKASRLLKDAWAAWKHRLRHVRESEALALSFSTRPSSSASAIVLQTWRRVLATHRNAHVFAVRYHSSQLQYKILLAWRVRLRERFKVAKQARMVYKFFIVRKAWMLWNAKFQERRREKAIQELERAKLKKCFRAWAVLARRKRRLRLAEQDIRSRVVSRIYSVHLSRWTNRVIDLKLRELDAVQRYETEKTISAYQKWRGVRIRHAEELRLMESYQEVKREESIRRMFHRWLSVARASRHRRVILQQKEDEIKRACLSIAWDQWRDRFCDERLRPIEYQILIQSQRSVMFRFLGIWRSRTKSLPAIKFHAVHLKAQFWQIWRQAIPRAVQAREAREKHRKAALSRCMKKWVQAYRTKLALKAVARARYLRLPTATPRPNKMPDRPLSAQFAPALFPRRTFRTELGGAQTEAGPSRSSLSFRGLESRTDRPRSAAGESEPQHGHSGRAPSPARSRASFSGITNKKSREGDRPSSLAGGEEGRSKLLRELQKTPRKPRPAFARGQLGESP